MDDIARAVNAGASIDEVERRWINPLEADEETRSALWLWAWGLQPRDVLKREVEELLALLAAVPAG